LISRRLATAAGLLAADFGSGKIYCIMYEGG
jgi:hypothetical protein